MAAGFSLLAMAVLGPVGLLAIQAVIAADPAETGRALILGGQFQLATLAFIVVALLDIVVAWGLWRVQRADAPGLALGAALLRVAYALMLVLLVVYLIQARRLAADGDLAAVAAVARFEVLWRIILGVFGLHLVGVGTAGLKSPHVPTLIAWLVALAGLGYIVDTLGTLLVPEYDLGLAGYLFFGEVVLMVWLLYRGFRG